MKNLCCECVCISTTSARVHILPAVDLVTCCRDDFPAASSRGALPSSSFPPSSPALEPAADFPPPSIAEDASFPFWLFEPIWSSPVFFSLLPPAFSLTVVVVPALPLFVGPPLALSLTPASPPPHTASMSAPVQVRSAAGSSSPHRSFDTTILESSVSQKTSLVCVHVSAEHASQSPWRPWTAIATSNTREGKGMVRCFLASPVLRCREGELRPPRSEGAFPAAAAASVGVVP